MASSAIAPSSSPFINKVQKDVGLSAFSSQPSFSIRNAKSFCKKMLASSPPQSSLLPLHFSANSGRNHFNQSRRSWQTTEHDGLLGSGSFPKSSGNAAGLSAPNVRPNEPLQLNRSNEPYHPPRPYKAVPHLRRGTTDLYNDETFGSTECTSQDKAEEEKRRRESFELMRKEQQKALQEKQKNPDKHKDGFVSDFTASLEDAKDGKRVFNRSNGLDESSQTVSNYESCKSSSQILGSRPLVPPGFKSAIVERNSSVKALNQSHAAEVPRTEVEQSLYGSKAIVHNGTLDNQEESQSAQKMGFREQQQESTSIHTLSVDKGEQIVDSSAVLEVSFKRFGVEDELYQTTSLSEASETQDGSESVEFDMQMFTGKKIIGGSKQDQSTTILQNLFGSASKANLSGSSDFIKRHDTKRDDTRSSNIVPSSKFAQWFLEDDIDSSFEAELEALELGMFVTSRMGHKKVIFEVDNLDIQGYLTGQRDIPPKYLLKFLSLPLSLFFDYEVHHVPREGNQVADALAKLNLEFEQDWRARRFSALQKHYMLSQRATTAAKKSRTCKRKTT